MPRLVTKFKYLKPGTGGRSVGGYARYIATREGVERIDDSHRHAPAPQKQQALIEKILRDFPDTKQSHEYRDYQQERTVGNASEFISMAMEENLNAVVNTKTYADYIATRPRAERFGSHGLFTDDGVEVQLSEVSKELNAYRGNVYTAILSLKREDAARLGFDHGSRWRDFLRGQTPTLSENLKIPMNHLRWYAAFHNEGHHPHVHLIAYSTVPGEGHLSTKGVEKMRSVFAREIFSQDHDYAKTMLKQIGYFSLIGGYKAPFKNPTTRKYKDGTRFEDIVALYYFDENLRELFLKYILKIERHIRALLSYHFSEKHGEQQCEYLNPANYALSGRNAGSINRLVSTLGNLANHNSDYPYINHQRQMYGNVPLWVLFNGVTFGSLSKFYSFTTQDIQTKVAKNFDKVNRKQLEQYLSVITKFRNVCAHGERLFSYQTRNDIPDTDLHVKLGIPKNGTQYALGKRDLFAVVIAFRYLLSNEDFKQFKAGLANVIQNYLKSPGAMGEASLYQHMGFPSNWSKITAYKK